MGTTSLTDRDSDERRTGTFLKGGNEVTTQDKRQNSGQALPWGMGQDEGGKEIQDRHSPGGVRSSNPCSALMPRAP